MVVNVVLPNVTLLVLYESLLMAKYKQSEFTSAQCHIHPFFIFQKTYVLIFVGSNIRDDNDISLLTLERINSTDFDIFHDTFWKIKLLKTII